MGEVKSFFEQDAYVNHSDQVKAYISWALRPDGPAFHKTPTPITCTFKSDHQEYIVNPLSISSADSKPLALAPRRHISITDHEQSCKALSPSSKRISSGSANQRLKSTEGTLWASTHFCILFRYFYFWLVLTACNRSSSPSLLLNLGARHILCHAPPRAHAVTLRHPSPPTTPARSSADEPQNWLTVYFSVLKLLEAELQLRAT